MGSLKTAYYSLGSLVFLLILLIAWWAYAEGIPRFDKRLTALENWVTSHVSGGPPS